MHVLSVDLGTSNTVAVLAAHGRPPRVIEVDGSATMPSAVFAAEDGTLVVGRDAERRARLDPARFEPNPKRRVDDGTLLLGDAVVTVTDALAAVLHEIAKETARQLGGVLPADGSLDTFDVEQVRLTHPAEWGPVRRNVLLAAARLAGLGSNPVLIPEPVAAAAHFASFPGHSLAPGQALAIYDLGAGTFDCTVVAATDEGFAVLAENGLPDLGGLDVDQALLEHVGVEVSHHDPAHWQRLLRPESTGDRRAQRALREDVKVAKEELSRHPQTEVPMPEPFNDVLVTRAELEALIKPSLLRSVEMLAATIESTGMNPTQLQAIYLVGGSSRIPLVAALIAERLRVVPTSLDQPETAVALGAHDVPADGISVRTQDLSRQVAAANQAGLTQTVPPPAAVETTANMPPVPSGPQSGPMPQLPGYEGYAPATPPGGYPNTAAYPNTGGFSTGGYPGTGGYPVTGGYPAYQPGPATVPSTLPGGPAGNRRRNRLLLIGGAAVVVVALLVVGGIFWLGGSGGGTDIAAGCRQPGGTANSQGFTQCMQQLAGGIPQHARCQTGAGAAGAALSSVGTAVTCVLGSGADGYTVTYLQGKGADVSPQAMLTRLLSTSDGERVEAQWQGNGLRGRYEAGTSPDLGVLVFSVDDSPLLGVLTKDQSGEGRALKAGDLADYFERAVEPGS